MKLKFSVTPHDVPRGEPLPRRPGQVFNATLPKLGVMRVVLLDIFDNRLVCEVAD